MNEAINTNEVKRRIQCCIDTKECILCPFFKIGCDKSTFAKLMRKAVQQLEDHIRDLTKMMPTWISVEDEQKPKHLEQVLCTYGFDGDTERHVDKLTYFAYGDNGYVTGAHFTDEGMCGMRVTHWMPRPEPPKEGTK